MHGRTIGAVPNQIYGVTVVVVGTVWNPKGACRCKLVESLDGLVHVGAWWLARAEPGYRHWRGHCE